MINAEDFVSKESQENLDVKNMDPWEVIQKIAKTTGMELNDPKPSCKKCHGRGWIGRHADSGEPIACSCIFPKQTFDRDIGIEAQYLRPRNRAERRARR